MTLDVGHFYLPEPDKWRMNDTGADFVFTGNHPVSFMLPNGLKEIVNYSCWSEHKDEQNIYPLISTKEFNENIPLHPEINFVAVGANEISFIDKIKKAHKIVLVLSTTENHAMASLRYFIFELIRKKIDAPVVISRNYTDLSEAQFQLYAATDIGGLLIDGLGDGTMLNLITAEKTKAKLSNSTAFGILQAARTRMTKTEYISCPSCGRTLFDLQETTAMIRKRTDHLKGVKIGIMGCIVNGPGEMADADYGYVGSGKGKITLYKGQEVIKRSVPSKHAVDELIEIIKSDGAWVEPDAQPMLS